MFLFLPIRTEKDTVRLPYLTMGLITLNLLIWVFTQKIVTRQMDELAAINQRLLEIEISILTESSAYRSDPASWHTLSPEEVHARFLSEGLVSTDHEAYEEWKNLIETFDEKRTGMFYNQWGYIPASPQISRMLTSLFVHGGFMHVFFNMLFLWIVGCNIEDDWKWARFLVFYLASGIAACLIHTSFSAGSTVPLIGASGAVAGVMGAFLIHHYNIKIRFWYFIWLLIRVRVGTFTVAAYVVLPFWFLQELFYARQGFATGTAHWAHVGGFAFGGLFAIVTKYLDRGESEPGSGSVSAVESQPESSLRQDFAAVTAAAGTESAAMEEVLRLETLLRKTPEDGTARLEMARLVYRRGFQGDAMIHYNRALETLFETEDVEGALNVFKEVKGLGMHQDLSESNLYHTALMLEKNGYYKAAVSIFGAYIKRFPRSPMRAGAIYRTAQILRNKLRNESLAHSAMALLRREYPDYCAQAGS
ncbi:MAG TPA: rhomboid family intramembrane serine protease [bacterium]|nr:rhomboid family intramembrane serine protease [bacterium]